MVPLVEPIRPLATGYPGPYPGNIYGQTPHSTMANQITALLKSTAAEKDYVTVHTVVGESGQGIVALKKPADLAAATGTTGRAYAATIFEVTAIARLAKESGKSYGVSVIVMTHGETDVGNPSYEDELIQLLADYNADISAITGQTRKIPMYLSQQHGVPNGAGQRPLANQTQWQLGVAHKGEFVCIGPQYQYPGNESNDGVHLSSLGYSMLGEKNGQVYYERELLGHDWQPLAPTSVERSGRGVTVHLHVPVPPLAWDDQLDAPAIAEWVKGRGFELRGPEGNIVISSVEIVGDSVQITADGELPTSGLFVGYALSSQGVQMTAASKGVRWGQLRDSDPFVGLKTQAPSPNYAVSFELPVP
jgi:lysophospholipase L1-like esterase